jgi:hypothetical protein
MYLPWQFNVVTSLVFALSLGGLATGGVEVLAAGAEPIVGGPDAGSAVAIEFGGDGSAVLMGAEERGEVSWWKWTPETSAPVLVEATGSRFFLHRIDPVDGVVRPQRWSKDESRGVIVPAPGWEHRLSVENTGGVRQLRIGLLGGVGNDRPAGAIDLGSSLGVEAATDVRGAGLEGFELRDPADWKSVLAVESGEHQASVWWRWTAPRDGAVSVVQTSAVDAGCGFTVRPRALEAFADSRAGVEALSPLASGGDAVGFEAVGGRSYLIRSVVGMFYRSRGQLLEADSLGSALVAVRVDGVGVSDWRGAGNDGFSGALDLGVSGEASSAVERRWWSAESGEPAHGGRPAARSAWWRWTAMETGDYVLSTRPSWYAAGVYRGESLGGLETVASGFGSLVFRAERSQTYRIALDAGPWPSARRFELYLVPVSRVGNGALADAVPLGPGSTGGWTGWFSDGTSAEAWFRWHSALDGQAAVRVRTDAAGGDPALVVSQVVPGGAGPEVAAGVGSAQFRAEAGGSYVITVSGHVPGSAVSLEVREVADTPANDAFAAATDLALAPGGAAVSRDDPVFGSTMEPGEPGAGWGSVWYRFNIPRAGVATVESDLAGSVYRGSSPGDLETVATLSAGETHSHRLPEGGVFWLQVRVESEAGYWEGRAKFSLRVDLATPNTGYTTAVPLLRAPDGTWRGYGTALDRGKLWWVWTAERSGLVEIGAPASGAFGSDVLVRIDDERSLPGFLPWVIRELWQLDGGVSALEVAAGERLLIEHYYKGAGSNELVLRPLGPVPALANDSFGGRADVGEDPVFTVTTGLPSATAEHGEPDHVGEPAKASQWWSWRPPAGGRVAVLSETEGARVAFYRGDRLETLEALAGFGADQDLQYFDVPTGSAELVIAVDSRTDRQVSVSAGLVAGGVGNLAPEGAAALEGDRWEWTQSLWGAREVWLRWVAPRDASVRLEGGNRDVQLDVFRRDSTGGTGDASPVARADGWGRRLAFDSVAGGHYLIRVGARDETLVEPVTVALDSARPNDRFSDRSNLGSATSFEFALDLAGSGWEDGEPLHGGASAPSRLVGYSLWWSWQAPSDGWLSLHLQTPGVALAGYLGDDVSALEEVFVVEGGGQRLVRVSGGDTYALAAVSRVGELPEGFAPSVTGTFIEGRTPVGDDWANAVRVAGTSVSRLRFCTLGATREPGEPVHGGVEGQGGSVWLAWSPATGGGAGAGREVVTIEARDDAPDIDPVMAVYTGDAVASLQPVTWGRSKVGWTTAGGGESEPYWIAIAAVDRPDGIVSSSLLIGRAPLDGSSFASYADWVASEMGPDLAALSPGLPGADPDADGRPNLEEFAAGTYPLVAEDAQEHGVRMHWNQARGGPVLSVPASSASPGLSRRYEVSSDLVAWRGLEDQPGFFEAPVADPASASGMRYEVDLWRWTDASEPGVPNFVRVWFEEEAE